MKIQTFALEPCKSLVLYLPMFLHAREYALRFTYRTDVDKPHMLSQDYDEHALYSREEKYTAAGPKFTNATISGDVKI